MLRLCLTILLKTKRTNEGRWNETADDRGIIRGVIAMLFSHDFESNEFNRAVDRFELDNKLKAGIERHRERAGRRLAI